MATYRNRFIFGPLTAILMLLGPAASVPAGDLDSPSAPGATSSYTLEDVYNRLDAGTAGSRSSFTEPANGPTAGTMHTVNEIMAKAPARDETNGATDTDVSAGKTYWGLTNGAWGVRNGTGSAGGLAPSAAQYVFVELAEGNTDVQNGAALLAAYTQAKGLTPGAANRIAVIVPPGRYDLGTGAVTLDTAYIDLVGLTTDREAQYIYGTSNGAGTGVLMQTADNVVIANLTIECTRSSGSLSQDATGPAAYFPNTNLPHTTVRNCLFTATEYAWSMRISIEYAGTYEDCTGGRRSFGGGGDAGGGGTASGTFTNCTGGRRSFGGGGFGSGSGGTASGTFTNCTGGDQSFGSLGTASGTFTNCTAGGGSFGGGGTASGTFTRCTGGNFSFGSGDGGTAGGTFTRCTGGNQSFGSLGTASGTFTYCTGGDGSFGGFGTASGTFTRCTGGNYTFGGGDGGTAVGGIFYYCNGVGDKAWASDTSTNAKTVYCIKNGAAYP